MTALREIQRHAGAQFMGYGPPPEQGGVEIVQDFGAYPAEYAAVRQRVGLLHLPQRAVLRFTGADRQDFLHRMLSQEVQAMRGGQSRRTFQLNEKGRVLADAIIHHGDADTWLELDRFDLADLQALLEARLFAEDVNIEDWTDQRIALALHGPAALALLQAVLDAPPEGPVEQPGTHHIVRVAGGPLTAYRWDDAGTLGMHLLVPTDAVAKVYDRLLEAAGFNPQAEVGAGAQPSPEYAQKRREGLRGRPVGWLAYNTARIEAGTPIFHIDFGRDSLPAETGLLDHAVSLTKGCYLGQEIVARMHSRGHPRRVLMGLKLQGEALPVAGAQVFEAGQADQVIGGVTSSTVSPLLGQVPIAYAVLKWGKHEPGTRVAVAAEGQLVEAEVHRLRFLED